jgi:DNA adenine methylase
MSERRVERSEPAKRRASEASLSEQPSDVEGDPNAKRCGLKRRSASAKDVRPSDVEGDPNAKRCGLKRQPASAKDVRPSDVEGNPNAKRWGLKRRPASATDVRPILKWAGGKRQLLPKLRPYYPPQFRRYFEPFTGSGAVFLDLHNAGLLDGREVRLSDINADVIGCYRMVRDGVDEVIAALRVLESGYGARGSDFFYDVRDRQFNPARRTVHASPDPSAAYTPALAAMLIFLNRTGYNGLFRVNARGEFNVPAGRHVRPRICDEDNLRLLSAAFARPGVMLEVVAFDKALAHAGASDFVYLDPPYAPLSVTARFTAYTAGGFGQPEQERLQQAVIGLAARGAFVLLSNSSAPEVRRLYASDEEARKAGLRTTTVPARRAINSRGTSRGPVREYVITNIHEP